MRNAVTFTVYPSARSRVGETKTTSWEDWAALLTTHRQIGFPSDVDATEKHLNEAKLQTSALILGYVEGNRSKKNVQTIEALALDLEKLSEETVLAVLRLLDPFEWVSYTTHKHGAHCTDGNPRLRVILPLDDPYPAKDHPHHWNLFYRMTGCVNDASTKDASRLHFLPTCFDPALAMAHRHTPPDGRWISTADLLAGGQTAAPEIGTDEPTPRMAARLIARVGKRVKGVKNKMRAVRNDDERKAMLTAIREGRPFAEPGDRHASIVDATWWLADKDRTLSREAIDQIFGESIAAMRALDPDCDSLDDVWTAYEGACEKIVTDRIEERVDAQTDGWGPYDDDEMRAIAQKQGWDADAGDAQSPAQILAQRWLIHYRKMWWMLGPDGRYHGAYDRDEAQTKAVETLARSPARLIELDKEGNQRYRSILDVTREVGQVAENVVMDMRAQFTRYEFNERVVVEARCPIRWLGEPHYDEGIDHWFKDLAGDKYDKLVDWVSCVPDLDKLLCAIYLHGPKGVGKTLLPYGLAKLWTNGPPGDLAAVLGQFNDDMARCPLLLGDEYLPRKHKIENITAQLRSMISTKSRTFREMYRPRTQLLGAIRVVLAANNDSMLDIHDVATQDDLDAIAERFLYIRLTEKTLRAIEQVPYETRDRWEREGIARHAMWLMRHHKVERPGNRFWVQGELSEMHLLLVGGAYWNSLVLEWCVGYCMDPGPFDRHASGLVRRGDGHLLVNVEALTRYWQTYIGEQRQPSTQKIAEALRSISRGNRVQKRWNGRRIWFMPIDVNMLFTWSDNTGKGDRETMAKNLMFESADESGIPKGGGTLFGNKSASMSADDGEDYDLEGVPGANREDEPI